MHRETSRNICFYEKAPKTCYSYARHKHNPFLRYNQYIFVNRKFNKKLRVLRRQNRLRQY